MAARSLVFDDNDPSIQYDAGGWSTPSVGDTQERYGPVYRSTVHETSNGANLTFTFAGSEVRLFGYYRSSDSPGRCTVGGELVASNTDGNGRVLCHWSGNPGTHTLEFGGAAGGQLFVDKIESVPSDTETPADSVVSVNHRDSAISYSPGWTPEDAGTQSPGSASRMQLDFEGTHLAWWGFIPQGSQGKQAGRATYSIGGQSPIGFDIPPASSNAFNVKLFETSMPDSGPHRLLVVYEGGTNVVPLTLVHLVITDGRLAPLPAPPLPSASSPASSSPSSSLPAGSQTTPPEGISSSNMLPSQTGTAHSSSISLITSGSSSTTALTSLSSSGTEPTSISSVEGGRKTPVGAIAGGVVGGVVLIVAAILFVLFLRRRKAQNRIAPSERYMQSMRGTFASPSPQEHEQMQPLHEKQGSLASSDVQPRGSMERRVEVASGV